MEYFSIHNFDINEDQMITIQNNLRKGIRFKSLPKRPQLISGVDVIYSDKLSLAVLVTFDFETKKIVECTYAIEKITFDYKPGLLAFHELPAFLKAWTNLTIDPDLVVFDGYGYTHPRRVGLATHASFFIHKPTFGIAKTLFVGEYVQPSNKVGDSAPINFEKEITGTSLRTLRNSKPVYLSIGNYITLKEVLNITKQFIILNHRIPLLTLIPNKMTKKLKNLII